MKSFGFALNRATSLSRRVMPPCYSLCLLFSMGVPTPNRNRIQSQRKYARSQEIHAARTVRSDRGLITPRSSCCPVTLHSTDGEAFRLPSILMLRAINRDVVFKRNNTQIILLKKAANVTPFLSGAETHRNHRSSDCIVKDDACVLIPALPGSWLTEALIGEIRGSIQLQPFYLE